MKKGAWSKTGLPSLCGDYGVGSSGVASSLLTPAYGRWNGVAMAQRKILGKGLAYLSQTTYCSSCKEHGNTARPSGTGVEGDTPGFQPGEASSTLAFRSDDHRRGTSAHGLIASQVSSEDVRVKKASSRGAPTGVDSAEGRTRSGAGLGFESQVLHRGRPGTGPQIPERRRPQACWAASTLSSTLVKVV